MGSRRMKRVGIKRGEWDVDGQDTEHERDCCYTRKFVVKRIFFFIAVVYTTSSSKSSGSASS